jgi:hypothetical protein
MNTPFFFPGLDQFIVPLPAKGRDRHLDTLVTADHLEYFTRFHLFKLLGRKQTRMGAKQATYIKNPVNFFPFSHWMLLLLVCDFPILILDPVSHSILVCKDNAIFGSGAHPGLQHWQIAEKQLLPSGKMPNTPDRIVPFGTVAHFSCAKGSRNCHLPGRAKNSPSIVFNYWPLKRSAASLQA